MTVELYAPTVHISGTGTLQSLVSHEKRLIYTDGNSFIALMVLAMLYAKADFTARAACSSGVHPVSLDEHTKQYRTHRQSGSPAVCAGTGSGAIVVP